MRVLHTSDLHFGKKTERIPRIEEQRKVVEEICDVIKDGDIDLLLVAGDVFDSNAPLGDAEELFFDFVCRASERAVVAVIPGNHDDAVKLCAASPISCRSNIYLLSALCAKLRIGGALRAAHTGAIELECGGERAVVAYLPYPVDSRIYRELNEQPSQEAYSSRIGRWLALGASRFCKGATRLGLSHLFVTGAAKSGDEQDIELGTARLVNKEDLPKCDYMALGHVHRAQKVSSSANAYYSGAILQYAFGDEGDKSVNIFDSQSRKVEQVALKSGKRLVRVEAASVGEAEQKLDALRECIVELSLTLGAPLTSAESKMLAEEYPFVARRRLILPESKEIILENRTARPPEEIFAAFYTRKFGQAPDPRLASLFLEVLEEEL